MLPQTNRSCSHKTVGKTHHKCTADAFVSRAHIRIEHKDTHKQLHLAHLTVFTASMLMLL